ncbi:hypothetical protein MUP07_01985 [Candidatus Bathyarchaeota archaeon]|nr:hypothetical protein [Candidatus Bathyarchaeota archaeon]
MTLVYALDIFALLVGILIGAFIIYLILNRKIFSVAESRAREMSTFMFNQQRSQLESAIHSTYAAKLDEWKATELTMTIQKERGEALDQARTVLKGKIAEQMAPMLPEFVSQYNPAEARFIGSPVDYVIFKNLSKVAEGADEPLEIVFLDVKAGLQPVLTRTQKKIKESTEAGKVKWETLHIMMPTTKRSTCSRCGMNVEPSWTHCTQCGNALITS